ncbi:MAG: MFS transporter [Chloroflexi bacterium]|nr:MFS transporter [Chloroflexota bacterium]
MLTSRLTASWQVYFYYSFLVGLGVGCAGPPVFTTVSRWFVKRRGLALGIVTAGIGLGTVIMAPVARWLISEYDWRTSCWSIGLAASVIMAAALFLRKEPSRASLWCDDQTGHEHSPPMEGLTLSQALRTDALWLMILLHTFAYTGLLMVIYHLVAHAEDMGIPEMSAASLLSVVGGVSIIGRVGGGIGCDKLGKKPTFIFSLLLQAAMMVWLIKATSAWMFYVFAALWGFGYGGWAPVMPALTGELFGLRHMGSILGVISISFGIGGVVGPIMAGEIYTATGSYNKAWLIAAVAMSLAALIVVFLRAPKTGAKRGEHVSSGPDIQDRIGIGIP